MMPPKKRGSSIGRKTPHAKTVRASRDVETEEKTTTGIKETGRVQQLLGLQRLLKLWMLGAEAFAKQPQQREQQSCLKLRTLDAKAFAKQPQQREQQS